MYKPELWKTKQLSKMLLFTGDIYTQIFPLIRLPASLVFQQCSSVMTGRKLISRIFCTRNYLLRHMQCFHYEINGNDTTLIRVLTIRNETYLSSFLTLWNAVAIPLLFLTFCGFGNTQFSQFSFTFHLTHMPLLCLPKGANILPYMFLK